jgi:hypothetical protein
VSKLKLKWSSGGEGDDFDAATKYLSLLMTEANAKALVRDLRAAEPVNHAAKDLLRASQLPLLPRDDAHVAEDLRRIDKGKPLSSVLVVRGEITSGAPLLIADGYHRICAAIYFDESAPVVCRIADRGK